MLNAVKQDGASWEKSQSASEAEAVPNAGLAAAVRSPRSQSASEAEAVPNWHDPDDGSHAGLNPRPRRRRCRTRGTTESRTASSQSASEAEAVPNCAWRPTAAAYGLNPRPRRRRCRTGGLDGRLRRIVSIRVRGGGGAEQVPRLESHPVRSQSASEAEAVPNRRRHPPANSTRKSQSASEAEAVPNGLYGSLISRARLNPRPRRRRCRTAEAAIDAAKKVSIRVRGGGGAELFGFLQTSGASLNPRPRRRRCRTRRANRWR